LAKAELGTKRTCPTTGQKFYDLNKDPVVSPYTGQTYPRNFFEPMGKLAPVAALADDESADLADLPVVDFVPLDEVDVADDAKAVPDDDIDLVEDIDGDDDTFLAPEEEEDDADVSDLIDGEIEEDEEG
jgi:uncharacterized protein (TIGR02300 family)